MKDIFKYAVFHDFMEKLDFEIQQISSIHRSHLYKKKQEHIIDASLF
jgi:hypothetical protein